MALEGLVRALREVEFARRCIDDNVGYDKATAREAYEHCVDEVLWPALVQAIEELAGAGVSAPRSVALAHRLLDIGTKEGVFFATLPSRKGRI